ncbi:MAG: VWA domain-containing protein, partial [Promethearchaeota archaeon]
GNIYRNWGDLNKAKECYDKAIEIGEKQEDIMGLSSRYNNRALLLLSEENWTGAMNDFEKALKIDKEMSNDEGIATRKRNIGVLHILKNELNLAQDQIDEAFRLDSKWENTAGLAEDEFQLGRLALLKNNTEIAEGHLKNSLKYAEKLGNYPLMKSILETVVQLYETQENTTLLHKAELELSKINDLLVSKKDVVFVIDQSGSMAGGKMVAARTGALGVFNETINIGDRVAIIAFHSISNILLELKEKKGNVSEIIGIFNSMEATPYQTCLYDTIALAMDKLKEAPIIQGEVSEQRQRWVVTLTDGQDNQSHKYDSRKLAKYIKEFSPPLNFILIGVGQELRQVHRKMTQMVAATPHGRYIPIYSATNVQKHIAEAFTSVKQIMASSEIEGFVPEEV